jgi:hypothetical protein
VRERERGSSSLVGKGERGPSPIYRGTVVGDLFSNAMN